MKSIKLGGLIIGEIPRVVGTVCSAGTLRLLEKREDIPCDIIEVRLDELWPIDDWWKDRCCSLEKLGLPVILTIRAENEGGRWTKPAEDRLDLFKEAIDIVSAIDMELRNGIPSEIRDQAASLGVNLIVSYHDFNRTPALSELMDKVQEIRENGADIVKIATMVNCRDDVDTLTNLTVGAKKEGPICVIGMGSLGAPTRLSLPTVGSALTYGYLGKPCAPGQLPCSKIYQYIQKNNSG